MTLISSSGSSGEGYVPPGVAHGFLTLTDGAEVFYQMADGRPLRPEHEADQGSARYGFRLYFHAK